MDNDYILKHDFGYGREEELEELNKLKLRDIKDVELYVTDVIKNSFAYSIEKKVFLIDTQEIEEVKIELL